MFEFPAAKVDKVSGVATDSEAGMGGKDAKEEKDLEISKKEYNMLDWYRFPACCC